jgi:hypothetical protein
MQSTASDPASSRTLSVTTAAFLPVCNRHRDKTLPAVHRARPSAYVNYQPSSLWPASFTEKRYIQYIGRPSRCIERWFLW